MKRGEGMKLTKILFPILFLSVSLVFAKNWTPYEISTALPYQETLIGDYVPIVIDTSYRGTVYVYFPSDYRPSRKGFDVLVHFHTSPWLIEQEFAKAGRKAVIVTINFPGLSGVYSGPFQKDTTLFRYILNQTISITTAKFHHTKPHIRHLAISSFSAGYGAVGVLLKQPEYYNEINEVLLVDSLHASIKDTTSREVVTKNLDAFVPLVKDAVKRKKTFVSTHSSILPATYAGTPETNAYLISVAGGKPTLFSVDTASIGKLYLKFDKGNFHVRGYTGDNGAAHLAQVRAIKYWYEALKIGK